MRHLAWSLSIGVLAGLGAGPFFAPAAYAQTAASARIGNAPAGTPLGNQQQLTQGNPMQGTTVSPGSISPSIGGVNGSGAVVGGTLNKGIYGSPGSISPSIGGVNGSGAVVGGTLNKGIYGSPGSISAGIGGVNGSGAVVGGTLNKGIYGSPGSMSPSIGGVNGSGAVVGGSITKGIYGSPGTFSPSIGGVNGSGAVVAGSLNSRVREFENGGFGNSDLNGGVASGPSRPSMSIGKTGPRFVPGSYPIANTANAAADANANINYTPGSAAAVYNYNSAPNGLGGSSSAPPNADEQSAPEGRFEYAWW
jgi:hypothetical protein